MIIYFDLSSQAYPVAGKLNINQFIEKQNRGLGKY
jgi:hypothetical protein